MDIKPWKERVMATKLASFKAQGLSVAKDAQDQQVRLDEVSNRGGIVVQEK